MPFRDYPQYLRDILASIVNIREFRAGMSMEQVRADRKTEAAIERELQIITEAAVRLGARAEILCPQANWSDIRGFGNVLRHAYDRLDPEVLREVLDNDLVQLEPLVRSALNRLESSA